MSLGIASAIGGLGSLVGGMMQSGASKEAAQEQANASMMSAMLQFNEAQQANSLIQSIYSQNVARLQPFVGAGQGQLTNYANAIGQYGSAISTMAGLTGFGGGGTGTVTPAGASFGTALTTPFRPTMEQLAQTPGYQFALNQGLLATGFGMSANGMGGLVSGSKGAGPSGPLGKALVNYAEGAASQTFQQQWQDYMANNMQVYNMLAGVPSMYANLAGLYGGFAGMGENAAAQTGTMGTTAGGQGANALLTGAQGFGSYTTAGAAAQAAGTVGSANALAGGISGAASNLMLPFLLQANATGTAAGTSGGLLG